MGRGDRPGLRAPLRPSVQAIGIPLSRTLLRPSLPAALLLAALLAAGCTDDGGKEALDPITAPSPSPSPSPTPPPLTPVAGAVEVEVRDASRPDVLGFADDGAPAEGSVDAAANAVAGSIDAFLDAAQRGTTDLATLGAAWLDQADPVAAEVLRTGLTNADNPVAAATYAMQVQVEPDPTLVAVNATIERRDGTTVGVELVFDVTGEQPQLQLAGGAELV